MHHLKLFLIFIIQLMILIWQTTIVASQEGNEDTFTRVFEQMWKLNIFGRPAVIERHIPRSPDCNEECDLLKVIIKGNVH